MSVAVRSSVDVADRRVTAGAGGLRVLRVEP